MHFESEIRYGGGGIVKMKLWVGLGFVVLGWMTGYGQTGGPRIGRPDVPTAIQAPAEEVVVLEAHAAGVQIYGCHVGADGKPGWTLKAPEAELRDEKDQVIGRHFAGPTWKHRDGSEVTGKMVAKVDAPEAEAIPWLLVSATGHTGNGALGEVSSVQRIHTKGGQAPAAAECSAAKDGSEARSRYTADYYFYAAGK